MAKWTSPLFSDIRNKLGENVVFSMWKGRPYMRSYVKPANPQTAAQTAERAHMAAIVDMYQQNVKGTGAHVTAWNAEALKDLISGYNQFAKYGRGITYGTVNLAAGSLSIEVTDSKIPNDRFAVMVYDESETTYLLPTTKRGLGTYATADYTAYTPAADDLAYIVDTKVLSGEDLESTAALYKAVNNWQVDQVNGVITQLLVTA
jgi:hypothetical protein